MSFVQGNYKVQSGTSTPTITLPSNTAGNLLVLAIETASATAKIAVSDSAGNVWQTAVIQGNTNGWRCRIFYATNCNASAGTNTVTFTLPSSLGTRMAFAEYSGVATTAAWGSAKAATGNSTTASTGSFNVTNGDLVVAFAFMIGGSVSAGGGMTSRGAPDGSAVFEDITASGSTATMTATGTSGNWTIVAAAFHMGTPPSTAPYVRGDISGSSGSTTDSAVFPSNASGNFLVAFVEGPGGEGVPSISDTAGNTWVFAGLVNGMIATPWSVVVFYVLSCAASSGQNKVTATWSGNGSHRLSIAEYSPTLSNVAILGVNWKNSVTTITCSTLPASSSALIIACPFVNGNNGAAGTGYTSRKIHEGGNNLFGGMFIEDKVSSTSETPSATCSSGEATICALSVGGGSFGVYSPAWGTWNFAPGVVGVSYDETWDMPGAASPTTYSVVSGSIPPGLSLASVANNQGELSGTPTTAGTYTFTIRASNTYGNTDQAFSLTISDATGGESSHTYCS